MIIFLYGGDTFHSRQKLKELKDKFSQQVDAEANSINFIDGQTSTLEELSEKISTGSLFVKKRMIIVENIFSNKKTSLFPELIIYLKGIQNTDNAIIFWDQELNTKDKPLKAEAKKLFTFLSKQKFVQEFKPLTNNQLLSFVKNRAKLYGKDIKLPAASRLIGNSNNDVWRLDREIKKLSFFDKESPEISIDDVKNLVANFFDEDIFALTDALSTKNKSLAIKLLEEQALAGLSNEYVLSMLIRQFKILWQIKKSLETSQNQAEIAKNLKLHPFVVKKGIQQSRGFSLESLKNYVNKLIELDYQNKRGLSDLKTEFTLLISSL